MAFKVPYIVTKPETGQSEANFTSFEDLNTNEVKMERKFSFKHLE